MSAAPGTNHQPSVLNPPSVTTTSIHIPYLPNEVMCMVASHVDITDSPNLRLSAKVFREGTAARFARIYFQDRVYELSSVGLRALVKITEHPVFARHLNSVVIGFKDRRGTPKYCSLLDQAFSNLAANSNVISIGLRLLHATSKSGLVSIAYSRKTWQFFDKKMLAAARKETTATRSKTAKRSIQGHNQHETNNSEAHGRAR
ncbi:hypothetical protein AUEXF2481DRAFT_278783 [Aureobasidium subglaciale EXF-2481]|uniref:F-box domain-containing protein n=1 Tax=Aureobasidium subglaciale (strain EXF-2481) TaxID=1043005 RepID=A0A074YK72_AURSE|nr:uncharacterized protein AUEXF2481DRAFT_278783 [Aureobasidium subglaciale EXF-2481]KAI5209789.1 hypothetical protein E4T38_02369 [Aureobasidium subglaciale]KAI5228474.1 hypothetical protein E4T40_02148 [Aureobasidium subglaciale]KAI5232021.1 hypothetical protein E4T41_02368 [Aureobasidium subglaciale]KAI5265694.1 hypothetical protein E4T46_02146 [Aureobasidium subglaciale]KEQ94487.1 hypothetical protein AUEXF2481DRAFT_278783 [Aureobasidium subglaciale EXF-2481]